MLADELDYVVGVDTHRDEHVLAVVAAAAGRCHGQAGGAGERARLPGGTALRRGARRRSAGLGDRGHRPATAPGLRVISPAAARQCSRSAAHREPSAGCAAKTTRSTRFGRRGQHLPARRSRCRAAGERREALRLLLLARRSAVDVRREALVQLRSVIVTAPDRLRERAARPSCGAAARALQPPSPLELGKRRRARDQARAAQPRPPNRSGHRRSRRARTRAPRTRPRTRTTAARRAGRRPDRRRPADRRLVTPRPRCAPKPPSHDSPASPRPRLERPDRPAPTQPRRRPPTQPGPAHRRSSTAASTTRRPRTTSHDGSPKAKPTATPPACSSATSPATSTGYCNNQSR